MSDIFLCYSRSDLAVARRLRERFRAQGWSVFMDEHTRVGELWHVKIEAELHAARAVVALWSAKSRVSGPVREEAAYAMRKGILLPAFIERVDVPFGLGFGDVQTVDLVGWIDGDDSPGFAELLDSLGERLGEPEKPGNAAGTGEAQRPPARKVATQKGARDKCDSAREPAPAQIAIDALGDGDPAQPTWADSMGRDDYGLFADLEVAGIRQRFRWIAPGTFRMGSPENEPERYDDEIPHEVTLTRGYWLADTACTQALWQTVMGDNPSLFKDDPRNPVERVNWEDVQGFLEKLNVKVPGLQARLPTEAQWEYACRAGTDTPFSFGANITPKQVNYDGGHLPVDRMLDFPPRPSLKRLFRRKETVPVGSIWGLIGGSEPLPPNPFVLYEMHGSPNRRKETVPVGSLPPNPWGLYEMHGNVWEWCADSYGEYPKGAKVDPTGPSVGGSRVLRGGSCHDDGRRCRSAIRFWGLPVLPSWDIKLFGFRLALGQGASPGGEPAGGERAAGQPRGRRGGQVGRGGGTADSRVGASPRTPMPGLPPGSHPPL